jgi:glutathione S-transferase
MSELTFYHNPMSRGRIAHWMLEEVGVPYTVELIDFEKQEHKSAKFLAINPMGKIPAIVHGKTVVTEAAAICAYLADAFPAAKLAPAIDDPARGTYYRWLFFGAACVEPAVGDRAFGRPPVRPSALGYGSYEDTINALEQAVSQGDYILGDRFSAADVYVSSQIGWGMMTKGIDPRPAFQAYVERTNQRPAVKRMMEQNEKFAQQLKRS